MSRRSNVDVVLLLQDMQRLFQLLVAMEMMPPDGSGIFVDGCMSCLVGRISEDRMALVRTVNCTKLSMSHLSITDSYKRPLWLGVPVVLYASLCCWNLKKCLKEFHGIFFSTTISSPQVYRRLDSQKNGFISLDHCSKFFNRGDGETSTGRGQGSITSGAWDDLVGCLFGGATSTITYAVSVSIHVCVCLYVTACCVKGVVAYAVA